MSDDENKKRDHVGSGKTWNQMQEEMKKEFNIDPQMEEQPAVAGFVDFNFNDYHSHPMTLETDSEEDIDEAVKVHKGCMKIYLNFFQQAHDNLLQQGVIMGCPADQFAMTSKIANEIFEQFVHKGHHQKG